MAFGPWWNMEHVKNINSNSWLILTCATINKIQPMQERIAQPMHLHTFIWMPFSEPRRALSETSQLSSEIWSSLLPSSSKMFAFSEINHYGKSM